MIKNIINYCQKNRFLIIVGGLFFFLQLIYLNQLYLLRGERDIVLTGYSLAKTGRDLYGRFLPLEFKGLDMPTPFLAFYYSAFWWLIIPWRTVFFARLPFVTLTFIVFILVYEIVKLIAKNKKIAFFTAVIFLFSPGIYHTSRLALEVNLAFPLLLSGMLFYLKNKKNYSFIFFIFTYFTYNGFRPLLPFLLVFLELYFYLDHKKTNRFLKQSAINIFFFLILFSLSYFLVDGGMMRLRQGDLIFLSYDEMAPKVVFRRNTAIGPGFLKIIMNNKATATIYYIIDTFIKGQDLSYLFLKGDYSILYATTFTGQFFLVFLPLYYFGFLYLGRKWDKRFFYILGMILVALIPSLINIDYISFSIRSILASVGYAFILACGLVMALEIINQQAKSLRRLIFFIFCLSLFIELSYFGYNYFFRRPVTMSEIFFESERQISLYLLKNKKKYLIYDDSPRNILATYSFLNPQTKVKTMQDLFAKNQPYSFDDYTLKICPSSPKELTFEKNTIIADSCTDIKLYEKLNHDDKVKKIYFKDFSLRTAFFIIE